MQMIIVKRENGDLVSLRHVRCLNMDDVRRVQDTAGDAMTTPLTDWEFGLYQAEFNNRMTVHKDAGWLPYDAKMWTIDDLAILDDCHLAGMVAVNRLGG